MMDTDLSGIYMKQSLDNTYNTYNENLSVIKHSIKNNRF
jgi:hypothetical protein